MLDFLPLAVFMLLCSGCIFVCRRYNLFYWIQLLLLYRRCVQTYFDQVAVISHLFEHENETIAWCSIRKMKMKKMSNFLHSYLHCIPIDVENIDVRCTSWWWFRAPITEHCDPGPAGWCKLPIAAAVALPWLTPDPTG